MFVLPPPPRYPSTGTYNGLSLPPHTTMIETNNILSTPSGPEYQFLVGEGTYVLKEDLHLATPPPHPSEAPVQNPNPLATTPQAATAGTKLSLTSFEVRPPPPSFTSFFFRGTGTAAAAPPASIQEHPNENRTSGEAVGSDDGGGKGVGSASVSDSAAGSSAGAAGAGTGAATSATLGAPSATTTTTTPAFGEGTAALTPANPKDAGKRKKPKNNVTKSNSSFISRVIVSETLSKRLADRPGDGFFAFANINRAFQWLDLSSSTKAEYLTKILFTKAHCLCHDVNMLTKSSTHIDVIMGFSTGEIIWWEPISQRYTRLNKNGVINAAPVSEIRWIPGSENLFLASHMDGTLVVYDKEKEDSIFTPEEDGPASAGAGNRMSNAFESAAAGVDHAAEIQIHKSVHSKNQKFNPVASWKLSNQRINAFAFSPDRRHIAVVSEDGTLRIIDYLSERLLDLFYSYYGGLTCVCWSPDGKYVLTGGQDDLVSVWCVPESALVARCQGHQSWVTAVAFDPWRCDERNYRFGSVGEDCRLCLWDFSVSMLARPRAASVRHNNRGSVSSRLVGAAAAAAGAGAGGLFGANPSASSHSLARTADTAVGGGGRMRSNSTLSAAADADYLDDSSVAHPVEPRSRTAMLPPVSKKAIDGDPLCWLEFTEEAVVTSCKSGHIRTWSRPSVGA